MSRAPALLPSNPPLPRLCASFPWLLQTTAVPNVRFFGKSDPFVVIFRATEKGGWAQTFCSTIVRNNLNPAWPPQPVMPYNRLGAGDDFCPLKIEVWDADSDGSHDYMCEADVPGGFASLLKGQTLTLSDKRSKKYANKPRGTLDIRLEYAKY